MAEGGKRPPHEVSAGGVMVRDQDVAVIVPRRRPALALPKGHPLPGESLEDGAAREVREETGTTGILVTDLGVVAYWYSRGGRRIRKHVHFFLFRYVSGELSDHDSEVTEARWLPLDEARRKLSYPGERTVIERAIAALGAPAP